MKTYILFEDESAFNLLPLTFTRAVCDIRIGVLSIREKWEKYLQTSVGVFTRDYLQEKYVPLSPKNDTDNLYINGSVCPTANIVKQILALQPQQALLKEGILIALNKGKELLSQKDFLTIENMGKYDTIATEDTCLKINYVWDIFSKNGEALYEDFILLTQGRKSQPISRTNQVIKPEHIFIEEGAKVEFSVLNASEGFVYIGKGAEIMEGALIRGPFSLGDHAVVKMGAKIYGATTIGAHSKVGGEINNAVIFSYSNKAHDGFLGNAVIGEWCNLGAGTSNSNLKNNYSEVKMWNYFSKNYLNTGLQFCGLVMGDHTKSAINTSFNTGTIVGVSANIFGAGFPAKHIPSFTWGGAQGAEVYALEKAIQVAERVYARRNKSFTQTERKIMEHIFHLTHS